MKAKKITAACMAAGLALMGTAGVVSYAAGNPYENYKSAVVNTISEDNLTVNAAVQMKQNGKVIASGSAVYEKAVGVQYAGITAVVSGQSMVQEEYSDCNIKVKSDGSRYTEKSRKEIGFFCEKHNVKLIVLEGFDILTVSDAVGRRCGILTINDSGFADAFLKAYVEGGKANDE